MPFRIKLDKPEQRERGKILPVKVHNRGWIVLQLTGSSKEKKWVKHIFRSRELLSYILCDEHVFTLIEIFLVRKKFRKSALYFLMDKLSIIGTFTYIAFRVNVQFFFEVWICELLLIKIVRNFLLFALVL